MKIIAAHTIVGLLVLGVIASLASNLEILFAAAILFGIIALLFAVVWATVTVCEFWETR